jgi:hypothetical protein
MSRMSIEAPSAAAAFLLEDLLCGAAARAVRHGASWWVELEVDDRSRDDAIADVRRWLRAIGDHSTTVWVDQVKCTIEDDHAWASLRRRYTPPPKVPRVHGRGADGAQADRHGSR